MGATGVSSAGIVSGSCAATWAKRPAGRRVRSAGDARGDDSSSSASASSQSLCVTIEPVARAGAGGAAGVNASGERAAGGVVVGVAGGGELKGRGVEVLAAGLGGVPHKGRVPVVGGSACNGITCPRRTRQVSRRSEAVVWRLRAVRAGMSVGSPLTRGIGPKSLDCGKGASGGSRRTQGRHTLYSTRA